MRASKPIASPEHEQQELAEELRDMAEEFIEKKKVRKLRETDAQAQVLAKTHRGVVDKQCMYISECFFRKQMELP